MKLDLTSSGWLRPAIGLPTLLAIALITGAWLQPRDSSAEAGLTLSEAWVQSPLARSWQTVFASAGPRAAKTPRPPVLVAASLNATTVNAEQTSAGEKSPEVTSANVAPAARASTPARPVLIHTSPRRQALKLRLDTILIPEVGFEDVPLGEAVRWLAEESRKQDPAHHGINVLYYSPANSLPGGTNAAFVPDLSNARIRISPPLRDLTLGEAVEVIAKVCDPPLNWSLEEYGVAFYASPAAPPIFPRRYQVNPDTFQQGLQSVVGGTSAGAGKASNQQTVEGASVSPDDDPANAPTSKTENPAGRNLAGEGGSSTNGVLFTRIYQVHPDTLALNLEKVTGKKPPAVQAAVREFLTAAGVSLATNPAAAEARIFYNENKGLLLVRAGTNDLAIIEKSLLLLNTAPPQVMIEVRLVEMTAKVSQELGFDWFTGRGLGLVSTNPLPLPRDLAELARTNTSVRVTNQPVPAVTGILTEAQRETVFQRLKQTKSVDLLSAPRVITGSGRQAQIQISDLVTIVTAPDFAPADGRPDRAARFQTSSVATGPVVDLIPTALPDGVSIRLSWGISLTEFVGYDAPGAGGKIKIWENGKMTGDAPLPLPRIRVRQTGDTMTLLDGQTIVVGGGVVEQTVIPGSKSRKPARGVAEKKNLLIFITPVIQDSAGNRVNPAGELPFKARARPGQK